MKKALLRDPYMNGVCHRCDKTGISFISLPANMGKGAKRIKQQLVVEEGANYAFTEPGTGPELRVPHKHGC